MKTLIALFVLGISSKVAAQDGYTIINEPGKHGVKILQGTIEKRLLQNDSSFKWYASSQRSYQPDSTLVNAFARMKDAGMHLVIFGGTWCEDTQQILPKLFKLQELTRLPDQQITLFGVNRNKVALGNITAALCIYNVPTFM